MAEISSFVDIELRSNSTQESKSIVDDLKKVEKANESLQKETKQTGDAAKKAGDTTKKSSKDMKDGLDSAGKAAKGAKGGMDGLGGGVKGMISQMSLFKKISFAAVIAGLGTAAVKAMKTFATFDQAIADLGAITGAAGKDLEFYSDKAREMGATTTLSASEVADAFRLVASAKPDLLSNAEALAEVTKQSIILAEAAGVTVPEAADTMASALNQFGAEADQAARFTNVLAAGSKFGAASIAEMGEALKFGGVVAGTFGLSFEETNAALQLFSTRAIKGGEAGTQLRGVLLALETKMSEEFRPSVVGLEAALQNLSEANLTAEESVKIFGNRNIVASEILKGNVEQLMELKENVTGTSIATEQAAKRTDTLSGANKRLGSALEELALVLTSDTGLGGAFAAMIDYLAEAILLMTDFFGAVEEGSRNLKAFKQDVVDIKDDLRDFNLQQLMTTLEGTEAAFKKNADRIEELRLEIVAGKGPTADLQREMYELQLTNNKMNSTLVALREKVNEATAAENELNFVIAGGTRIVSEYTVENEKSADAIADVTEKLKEELAAFGMTDEEQEIYNELKAAGVTANSLAGQEIIRLVKEIEKEEDALDAVKEAEKEAAVEAKALAKASEKAAKDSEKAWLAHRDTLSQFFFEFAQDGKNAFDTLFEGFKAMIMKMIAEAAANKILLSIGLPGMTAASTALGSNPLSLLSGASGVPGSGEGGILSGLSGFADSAFMNMSDAYLGVGNFAASFTGGAPNFISNAADTQAMGYASRTTGGNLAYGAANIGAGFAGSYLGNQVFGDTTGIGSFAGGAVGSLWGPVGTGVGSFLGAGLESLVTSIFGKGQGNNAAAADFDLSTGAIDSRTWGNNNSDPQNVSASMELADLIKQLGSTITGGTSYTGSVQVGSKDGISLDGTEVGNATELLDLAFRRIIQSSNEMTDGMKWLALTFEGTTEESVTFANMLIAGADAVSPTLVSLIHNFEGTAQETLRFSAAIISLNDLLQTNPVDDLIKEAGKTQESMTTIYTNQLSTLKELVKDYDGTVDATEKLTIAYAANRQTALMLADAILQVTYQMETMFASSAQQIRESIMTDADKVAMWTKNRDDLRDSLSGILDPAELQATGAEINRLNNLLFANLSEDMKIEAGELYAQYAEDTADIVSKQLGIALDAVQDTQGSMNNMINAMLQGNAAAMSLSINRFDAAVNKFVEASNTQADAANKQDEAANKAKDTSNTGESGLAFGHSGPSTGAGLEFNYTTGQWEYGIEKQKQTLYIGQGVVITNQETGDEIARGYYDTNNNAEWVDRDFEVNV